MREWIKSLFRPSAETEQVTDWRAEVKQHVKKLKAAKAQYKTIIDILEQAKHFSSTLAFELCWYEDEEDIKLLKFTFTDNANPKKAPFVLSIEDDGNIDEFPGDAAFDDPNLFAKMALGAWVLRG